MDCEEVRLPAQARADGALDGARDVVQLQVEEDALALGAEHAERFGAVGEEELEADLVERDGVADADDGFRGLAGGGDVEGDDQGVVFHGPG